MNALTKRSSFLGAILFITALLFANTAFAQVTPYWGLELWDVDTPPPGGIGTIDHYFEICETPGSNDDGTPCSNVPGGVEICLFDSGGLIECKDTSGTSPNIKVTFEALTADTEYTACITETEGWVLSFGADSWIQNGTPLGNYCVQYTPPEGADTTTGLYVQQSADLSITKTDNPVTVVAGENLAYTITAHNAGPSDVSDASITDTFDAALGSCGYTSVGDAGVLGNTASATAPQAGINDNPVTMPSGTNLIYTVTCAIPPSTPAGEESLSNTASISGGPGDPDSGNNSDTELTGVIRVSDLQVTKTPDSDPYVGIGTTLKYTIDVYNAGPSDADNVIVTEALPAEFSGATVSTSGCDNDADLPSGGVPDCELGTIAYDQTATYYVTVEVPDNDDILGPVTNTVTVVSDSDDPNPGDNTDAVLSEVVIAVPSEGTAVLSIQKHFSDGNNKTGITLDLWCSSGTYAPETVTVHPDDPGQIWGEYGLIEQTFIISQIPLTNREGVTCTVTEVPVPGYSTEYKCFPQDAGSMSTPDDSCLADGYEVPPDNYACKWSDVQIGDSNNCLIVNDPDPVEVAVTKVWDVTNDGGDYYDRDAEIIIGCDSKMSPYSWKKNDKWFYKVDLDDSDYVDGQYTITVEVIPDYPSSSCFAKEDDLASAVETTSDCGDWENPGMEVSVGESDSCTITNTLFFEGIPTLNQYGMALLALLMLGIGMVGFRRFA